MIKNSFTGALFFGRKVFVTTRLKGGVTVPTQLSITSLKYIIEKNSTCRQHKDTAFVSHKHFSAQFISVKILVQQTKLCLCVVGKYCLKNIILGFLTPPHIFLEIAEPK